ncbi:MAG: hypothetical protein ABI591_34090 [Kofleriaceae bacterium]
MKPPQEPVCSPAETFPETITNRPALDRIQYRVGDYANTRRWLLEQLDRSETLAAWTYRGADDPGIALYEGAALLIDSLTFYQEAYANEAFLRTATWRESVADLVRLLGYRLMPGIGGTGTFAFEIKSDKPVTIPTGVAIQAKIGTKNADFQTSEQIVALPWLSKFTLTRPQTQPAVTVGMTKLVIDNAPALAKNDRLVIGVTTATGLNPFELVIVDAVDTWHGRSVVTLRGPITKITGPHTSLTAMKLDKTFHLTGHNAPDKYVTLNASGTAVGATFTSDVPVGGKSLDLDPQVTDLALGTRLAIQVTTFAPLVVHPVVYAQPQALARIVDVQDLSVYAAGGFSNRLELATVLDAIPVTVVAGPMSVPSTVVQLAQGFAGELASNNTYNLRTVQVDTVVGEPFSVGAAWIDAPAPATQLAYWGPRTQANDLTNRRIGLAPVGKPSYEATVLAIQATWTDDYTLLALDREVDFTDFVDGNTTPAFGNLVDVTEGKQATEATLGNGDDRATFQSFQIPKSPLTYLDRAALTPPNRPEIEIVVGGRIWSNVDVLYGAAPDAEVYIVRQDDAGNSWVQFGDGKTGARLPSGVDNVVVRYRTGSGAFGALADGAKPSADRTVPQVTNVDLVGVIAGGAAPEDMTTAKIAAPARVQSLDRIVSITDVEAEALAIGGVAKARAVWTIVNGLPMVQVTLLMQPGRTAELASAQSVLALANRMRGPQRFPIVVVPGAFEYVYLDLTLAVDPTYDPAPVRDAVSAALGVSGGPLDGSNGLFGDRSPRSFGDAEYATRIEGVAQNVAGVQWSLVNALGSLGVADDPAPLVYPTVASRAETVACASTHVLRLYNAADGGPLILRIVPGAS